MTHIRPIIGMCGNMSGYLRFEAEAFPAAWIFTEIGSFVVGFTFIGEVIQES